MARPTTVSGKNLLVKVGNGADPEVFAAPCGLTTRGINFSKETNDTTVPDCDDPDLPSWTERDARTLAATVSGSGILAVEALPTWRGFFMSTDTKNCQIWVGTSGYFEGAFHCTSFNVTGEIGNKVQVEIELQNDGEVTWVDD